MIMLLANMPCHNTERKLSDTRTSLRRSGVLRAYSVAASRILSQAHPEIALRVLGKFVLQSSSVYYYPVSALNVRRRGEVRGVFTLLQLLGNACR